MIFKDNEALSRLNSPMNLLNRLNPASRGNGGKKDNGMSIFTGSGSSENVTKESPSRFEPPAVNDAFEFARSLIRSPEPEPEPDGITSDAVMDNAESKIKLSLVHDRALDVLHKAIDQMGENLDNIKPDKLPSVIAAASRTVEGIRKERNETLKAGQKAVNIIFYTPTQKTIDQYEVIDV